MLETMRKHSRSLFIYLIFGILIMVFIISFGPQSGQQQGCGAATPYVAKVNGREITETTWRYAILYVTGGRGASGENARRQQIKETVLDLLIVRELLVQTAEALGFRVSESEIQERITEGTVYLMGQPVSSKQLFWEQAEGESTPVFRAKRVDDWARNWGLGNRDRLIEELRKELLAQKVRELQQVSIRVSPEEVQHTYEKEQNKVDFQLVVFETARIRDEIDVTPAEIDAYLKAHEAELKAQYDKTPDRWKGREKEVRIRDIFFKKEENPKGPDAKARAAAALAKIKGGTDFAAAAKTLSENDRFKKRGGDVGWLPLRALRFGENVTKAVETMDKGQISDVIEAPDGYHIVQLVDKREGDLSFDMVKRDLAEEAIRDERSKAEAKKQAEDALAKAKAGTPLDKLFPSDMDTKGPRLQTLNDVERSGDRVQGIGESKEIATALLDEVQPGDLLPKVYEVGGDYYVLRLVARREPDMKKFQEDKLKLTAQMSRERASEFLFWWQGTRCQEASARKQIQFNPTYVTYAETDEKGQELRRMSYTPCMSFVARDMMLQ